MESSWTLVIIMWGALIGIMLFCLIPELRKTPEQRKAEADAAREHLKKHWEEEKRELREQQENVPARGCLQRAISVGFLCVCVMATLIFAIMVIISTGQ